MKYFMVFAHPENEHSLQSSLLKHSVSVLESAVMKSMCQICMQ
jgi:hypothetical protein